ncbi:MAG TPA: biotin--[acetyl-CoA-carboxylase] ligase [Nitrospira sp.]|nr:biotin--[acetyl-CoA-carboxylase] ligase [Nitrospira sp.]
MAHSLPLNLDLIRRSLATRSLGHTLEWHEEIDSTNRRAVMLAQGDAAHGTVVLADSQTTGRGRLGRGWFSPPRTNLYCSVIVKGPLGAGRLAEWLSWLPLTASLGAAAAIESVASVSVGVKWPNDLLVKDRKIGGILCESGSSPEGRQFQIIGIGINVNGTRADFPPDLRGVATTIADESGDVVDLNVLVTRLIQELEHYLEDLDLNGSNSVAISYRSRCVTLGKSVRASLPDGTEVVGVAEAIAADGSLHVAEIGHIPGNHRRMVPLRAADIVHLRPTPAAD